MKSPESKDFTNPLSDLISDEIYKILEERNLFNKKTLRDHLIRRKFKLLRESKIAANEAIAVLREEYPYLYAYIMR